MKKLKLFLAFHLTILPIVMFAQKTYYTFNENNKVGVINQDGKQIIPAIYNDIVICEQNFICDLNGKTGVINNKHKNIIPFEFENIEYKKVFLVEKNEKYGIIDKKGRVIIVPIIYDYISICSDGYIAAKDKKYGLLDNKGKVVIDFLYEDLGYDNVAYSENRIVFKQNNNYGYLDEKGKIVIPATFKRAQPFKNERAVIYTNEYAGTIDINGSFVIQPDKYEYIFDFSGYDGIYYAWGKKQGRCIISQTGDTIISGMSDDILSVKNGTIVIFKNHKYGLISSDGKVIIPVEYDGIAEMGDNGLIPVLKNGKWGFVNKNNEVVIDFKFVGHMETFSKGFAVFYADKFSSAGRYTSQKAGYVNDKGEIVIPLQFDSAGDFKNARAEVQIGTKKLLINTKGKIIFEFSDEERSTIQIQESN